MGRRRYVLLVLVLAAIGGGTRLLQRRLFPEAAKALEVLEVRGEVSRVGAEGETGLTRGAKVLPGERVRTGAEGEAVMRGAGSSTITVSERSSVTVDGVLDRVARISVEQGFVRARVKDGEGAGVQVRGGAEGATVLTRGGDVSVGVDGAGDLAVATFEGRASLTHGGTTREVGMGRTAVVAGGRVEIGEVPTRLLLKVAWPEPGGTREPTTAVSLRLPRGAEAFVNGAAVPVGPDGSGRAVVTLREGDNTLTLEARDVAGNLLREESGVIVLDTKPPPVAGGAPRWQ